MVDGFFSEVAGPIPFGGLDSTDPLTFKVYEPDRLVLGKRMEDHLRIARLPVALVQLARARTCSASGTFDRPWLAARRRPDGAAPGQSSTPRSSSSRSSASRSSASTIATSRPRAARSPRRRANLDAIVAEAEAHMARTGVQLLWGTANLFSHPRYAAGAATNPDPEVFAYAAAQVKVMLEATKRLGGANYVLWGGREGYETLLNTDLAREEAQLARFLTHGRRAQAQDRLQGHAPDRAEAAGADQAPVRLRRARRSTASSTATASRSEYRVNLEANHATLAGHSFHHEVAYAIAPRHLRQHRRQPRRLPERLGHRPVPELGRRAVAGGATRSCAPAGSRPAASTSTPSCAARAWTGPTCSTPTSAASTRSPGRCSSPPTMIEDGRARRDCARSATPAGTASSAGRSWPATRSLEMLAGRVAAGEIDPRPVSGRQELLENLVNRQIWAADRTRARIETRRRSLTRGPRPRDRRLDDGDQGRPDRRGRASVRGVGIGRVRLRRPAAAVERAGPGGCGGTAPSRRSARSWRSTGATGDGRRRGRADRPDARPRPARRRGRGPPAGDPVERPADRRRMRRDPRGASARSG